MSPTAAKIYGLIGYPVRHSLSPVMHNAAFKHLGINADYRLFPVKPEDLETFLLEDIIVKDIKGNVVCNKDIKGLNVTVPHKEKVLDFVTLDSNSFYLRQIKAINTLVKKDGKWNGFNTDIAGFSRHLKEHIDPANKRVAILGAGGAARAVAYVIADSKARNISIYDIDKTKSKNIAEMIKGLFPEFDIKPVEEIRQLNIRDKELLINATPVGLVDTDACLVGEELLHKGLFVYDLIYNPVQTRLLALAEKKGAGTANGLGMLLYQGMLSFKIWTGVNPPQEVMRRALCCSVR